MTRTEKYMVALVFMLIAGFSIASAFKTQSVGAQQGNILRMNISEGLSIATSSTIVLPGSSGRQYAIFVNDSANPIYLDIAGTAATGGSGIRLNASGGSYEMNSLNQTSAAITAIAPAGASNLTVTASQ